LVKANAKDSWESFESIRSIGKCYCPKLVFTSSVGVFEAPFPSKISDEFFAKLLTSYDGQKVVSEILLPDYSKKRMIDGISIRLPTICMKHCKLNLTTSVFF